MSRGISDKSYVIIKASSGDVVYSCSYLPEANRVFDLIRSLLPDMDICLNVVLRK